MGHACMKPPGVDITVQEGDTEIKLDAQCTMVQTGMLIKLAGLCLAILQLDR